MPNGKYAVDSGSNHRAVVSNEFGVKQIKANITTFLNKSFLKQEEMAHIKNKENERSKLFKLSGKEKDESRRFELKSLIDNLNFEMDDYLREIY